MKIFRELNANEIEVRVGTVKKGVGFSLLLYKNARCDMSILDETFSAFGWQCDYKEVKGNLYCGIGIASDKGYIWKWDCGIESKENEGNEKKGEASDAFKRAGFKWGIGRELYTSPFIWVNGDPKDYKGFYVEKITYENNKIKELIINENNGEQVFPKKYQKTAVEREEDTGMNTLSRINENAQNDPIDVEKMVYTLQSGMYKGKTLDYVAKNDMNYLKTLLKTNISAKLREMIEVAIRENS